MAFKIAAKMVSDSLCGYVTKVTDGGIGSELLIKKRKKK